MQARLGFIGVGVLAEYVCAGLRRIGDDREIVISPRGKEMAEQVARDHQARIAQSNQEVVDATDITILSTKPEHAVEAIEGLRFREDQILLSVVAGLSSDQLAEHAAPASVVRALPLIGTKAGAGATPIYPPNERVDQLFSSVSSVVAFEDENQYELAAVGGCLNGWVYSLVAQLQKWLEEQGFSTEQARTIAIETFHGATNMAKFDPSLSLQAQADHIGQPGTFTKTVIDAFDDAGGNDALRAACDAVHKRLTQR